MLEALHLRVASALFHQPLLLRAVADAARRSPGLSKALSLAASATAVHAVLEREAAFSRDHYAPVMIDGAFLIGERAGPVHQSHRAGLQGLLPTTDAVIGHTVAALPNLLAGIEQRLRSDGRFDLIDDYLVPLVWSALGASYGAPAKARLEHGRGELLEAARWLGAQLMIGSVATAPLRQRALRSAAVLDAAFADADASLPPTWPQVQPDAQQRRRDAVGLLWVGHPATTQGGAMMVQELLSRPGVHGGLLAEQAAAGHEPADRPGWRAHLRDHVLELLRFRPPFPILGRLAPRAGLFPLDAERVVEARAGSLVAMAIGALHDPAAQREDPREYVAGRHFHDPEDRLLMFGAGARHCIAREHVIEIMVSALAGLLSLDRAGRRCRLRYANSRWRGRIVYDGPVIVAMPLRG